MRTCVQIGIVRRVCLVESVSLQKFNDTLEMYPVALSLHIFLSIEIYFYPGEMEQFLIDLNSSILFF